jgi:hypothetical protein
MAGNNIYKMALVLAIVAVSGCTQSSEPLGNGVVIEAFTSDLPDAYPGELITFSTKFRNVGSQEATEVFAVMVGLDPDWYDPSESSYGGGPWVHGEKTPNEPECRYTQFGSSGYSLTLSPPSLYQGTPGEQHVCTWTYKVPDVMEGVSVTYNPYARILYKYETMTVKSITILPRNEVKKLRDSGETIPITTSSTTRSPITLDIETQNPIRFSGDNSITFPVKIIIRNVGGGTTCYHDSIDQCRFSQIPQQVWNKVKVYIEEDSGIDVSRDCKKDDGGVEITLYKGNENSIICDVTVDDLPDSILHKNIKIHADYFYMIDSELQITVTGR